MGHLTIKFAKYQIYLYILPTSPKSFIGINQVWPHLQPQKHMEVKFKIYTSCFPLIGDNNEKKAMFYPQKFNCSSLMDNGKLQLLK